MGEWNDNLFSSKKHNRYVTNFKSESGFDHKLQVKICQKTIVRCFLPEWLLLKNMKKADKNYFSILAWVSFRYLLSLSEFEWS